MGLITVKATQLGFDGMQRRRKDSVFEIEESKFSKKWMKRVGGAELREGDRDNEDERNETNRRNRTDQKPTDRQTETRRTTRAEPSARPTPVAGQVPSSRQTPGGRPEDKNKAGRASDKTPI